MIKKKYNPSADPDNLLVIAKSEAGCCGEDDEVCKYTATIDNEDLISITIDDKVIDIPAYTTIKEQKLAIIQALEANGYLVEGKDAVNITEGASGVLTYSFIGEGDVSVLTSTDDDYPTTVACTKVLYCDYKMITQGGATNTLSKNGGANAALGAITYPSTVEATLKATVAGAVTGEVSVTVVKDTEALAYVITIRDIQGTVYRLNGKQAIKTECVSDYTA